MIDFEALLANLTRHEVNFIVVGGAAAIAHGSARLTQHLDIVYQRSPLNLNRLVEALAECKPYLRGAPPGLSFKWDRTTGEIPGGGPYEDLAEGAIELQMFGIRCLCLSLPQLIRAKRAAGRPKDLEALAELETIEDEHE